MVLITRCCCWNSVRRGSFASGIFTLAVYLVLFTSAGFHIGSVLNSPELLTFSVFMLIFSFFCVASSVILLVGLCVDNRLLLLPWIAAVSIATLLEFVLSFYLIPDMIENPLVGTLFAMDIIICALNIYCILCVISQYQQYLAGRGRAGQRPNSQPIPTVRLQPEASQYNSKNLPSVSYQISKNGSPSGLLMVPSPNSSSTNSKSPVQTDMSSISDEASSNDTTRKLNTENCKRDTETQLDRKTSEKKSQFHSPFRSKCNSNKSSEDETQSTQLTAPDVIIKIEDTNDGHKSLLQRLRF